MLNKRIVFVIACVLTAVAIVSLTQIDFVNSSYGDIMVNRTGHSNSDVQITAGDPVNLYFGDSSIKWTGSNFYLLLSQDRLNTASQWDYICSPMFSVEELKDSKPSYYTNNEDGEWVVGSNWVNGTLSKSTASGKYAIKAFDFGAAGSTMDSDTVAVTDTWIIVNAFSFGSSTFVINPSSGPGGVEVEFSGSGYPANSEVVIGYYDQAYIGYKLYDKVLTDAQGKFSFKSEMPDLKKTIQRGDNQESVNQLQFRTQCQDLVYNIATYNQNARGLKSVSDQTAWGLYGNGTNLASSVNAKAGETFTITGKWFHPGVVYVLLDGEPVRGTVTANQWKNAIKIGTAVADKKTGSFEAEVTIPSTINGGEHYIAIEDKECILIIQILITDGTLQISPGAGAGGEKIQFTGSGYPPLSDVRIMYQDTYYSNSWNFWTTVRADINGNIKLDAEAPDLKKKGYEGDYSNVTSKIAFRTEVNDRTFAYAEYTQFARGLKQVGSATASVLFGVGTNLGDYNLKVKPGDSITIAGRYFHPGSAIYIKWDGTEVANTVTPDQWSRAQILGNTIADAKGSFSTTIKIPSATGGLHWVSIEDQETNFVIRLPVEATSTPTPTPSPTPTTSTNPPSSGGSGGNSNPKPTSSPPSSPDKATPTINIQSKSIPINGGFRVEISGTCTNNNAGIANKAIQLYSSKDGGKTWEPLTLVNTSSEGKFNAVWTSLTSGIFLIKAECTATTEYNAATATVNLAIEPAIENNNEENVFTITSNSTVSHLSFNSETSELSFTASGETGTTGYVSITIPKTLINNLSNLKVYLDGNEITYSSTQETDTWYITLTYTHSTHTITMNLNDGAQNKDNMTPWIIAAIIIASIILITATIAIVLKKKKHN